MGRSAGKSYSLSRIRLGVCKSMVNLLMHMDGLLIDTLDIFRLERWASYQKRVQHNSN